MAHFNVLKGEYPGLAQLDKTLPALSTEADIVRGSVLVVESGCFRRCVATDAGNGSTTAGKVVYHAFQAQTDPDAVMANGVTAMPCIAPVEIETDQFVASQSIVPGVYLMTAGTGHANHTNDGKLQLHADGFCAVGLVTKASYKRWSNTATPAGGSYPSARQGAMIDVIAFWSVYIPNLSIS
jgi:hypothetical protein